MLFVRPCQWLSGWVWGTKFVVPHDVSRLCMFCLLQDADWSSLLALVRVLTHVEVQSKTQHSVQELSCFGVLCLRRRAQKNTTCSCRRRSAPSFSLIPSARMVCLLALLCSTAERINAHSCKAPAGPQAPHAVALCSSGADGCQGYRGVQARSNRVGTCRVSRKSSGSWRG